MTPAEFQSNFSVSRETMEAFRIYEETLVKWQSKINLISPNTVQDIWHRHFADSAQIIQILQDKPRKWLDIGSGAGFPGMVIALMAKQMQWDTEFIFVESDQRKCIFLNDLRRKLDVSVEIKTERVEKINGKFDVISARALASLDKLLSWVEPLCDAEATLVFPKGRNVDLELTQARASWHIEYETKMSQTDSESTILIVKEFHRV